MSVVQVVHREGPGGPAAPVRERIQGRPDIQPVVILHPGAVAIAVEEGLIIIIITVFIGFGAQRELAAKHRRIGQAGLIHPCEAHRPSVVEFVVDVQRNRVRPVVLEQVFDALVDIGILPGGV